MEKVVFKIKSNEKALKCHKQLLFIVVTLTRVDIHMVITNFWVVVGALVILVWGRGTRSHGVAVP